MKFRREQSRRAAVDLDLVPMIDVVFQLVLFLVLATELKKEEREETERGPGIQVDLPRSSSQTILSQREDLNVWMARDGGMYLDDQPIDQASLRRAFRDAARTDPNTLVIIKADTGVSHGRVVGVMDLARNNGLSRLAIATTVGGDKEL